MPRDLQSAGISDQVALAKLRESRTGCSFVALIHQTLCQSKDFSQIDFGRFLHSLVPVLIGTYVMESQVDGAKVHLPINAATPCGLIVNELISNAWKHASSGSGSGRIRVKLSIIPNSSEVTLSVSDDGVGLPPEIDIDVRSLGLQLVSLLTEQPGGQLTTNRANPTRFDIRFAAEA